MFNLVDFAVALPLLTLFGAVFGRVVAQRRQAARQTSVWRW